MIERMYNEDGLKPSNYINNILKNLNNDILDIDTKKHIVNILNIEYVNSVKYLNKEYSF